MKLAPGVYILYISCWHVQYMYICTCRLGHSDFVTFVLWFPHQTTPVHLIQPHQCLSKEQLPVVRKLGLYTFVSRCLLAELLGNYLEIAGEYMYNNESVNECWFSKELVHDLQLTCLHSETNM